MRPFVISLLVLLTAGTAAAEDTPFPSDLPDAPAACKHRLAVKPFDDSAAKTPVHAGEGIVTMLTARLKRSETVALSTKPELTLSGDVVIFGRDTAARRTGKRAVKNDKTVVSINLRLVDAETGEVFATAPVRGEASGGVAQTAIDEAISNAVGKIVEFLDDRLPTLPVKPRQIEGRVADVTPDGAVLALGADDGVLRGDRFEILKIRGEIKNPVTKEVLDLDTIKIGEFVAENVRNKIAYGRYGGQPMWPAYATGRGYVARLMTK